MDTPFEQSRQMSEAQMEGIRNYYQKVQEHFDALQTYHRQLQDLYRALCEHNLIVQVLYHQVKESFAHSTQVEDHVMRAYDQAVREQRDMTGAYQDALQGHLHLMKSAYQRQNPKEQP